MAQAGFQVSDQLATIARWNPGITLHDDDVKKINAGQLVLVGQGAIIATGPGLPLGIFPGVHKGCIDWLFYGTGSDDLARFSVDGTSYAPGNLKDFRAILEQAAFHMKCINFCYDTTSNTMRMLNVYPQCCCRCEEIKT